VNRLGVCAVLTLFLCSVAPAAVRAEQGTALQKVAADLGYRYAYLGPEDAVSLSRPGVTILVRPGSQVFDVNDRTESMRGPVPYFSLNDIYVFPEFIERLKQIAAKYPATPTGGERAVVVVDKNAQRLPGRVSGAVTTLAIAQKPGQYSVLIDGKAPANLPITITLVATLSSILPDVTLSRTRTSTDADGRFHADVPIAPGYYTGAIISVVASSVPGITTRTTQIVMHIPNKNVVVPSDYVPENLIPPKEDR